MVTARRFALDYALHFPNRGELSAECLQSVVNLCRELNCTAVVIHDDPAVGSGFDPGAVFQACRLGLSDPFGERRVPFRNLRR